MLDTIEPPPPAGLTVQVTRSVADQVVVENTTPEDLEVLADDGEAFLRIGPRGVEGNVASREWNRSNAPDGVPSAFERGRIPPSWMLVSTEPSWGWFDHRLHRVPMARAPRSEPGQTTVLERWEIPMRLGGRPLVARGRRLFSRPAGHFRYEMTEQIPGSRAGVLDGPVPAISLRAEDSVGELLIVGTDGEPFARFRHGVAEVNEASPTWALTARARGAFHPTSPIGPEEPPRWRAENQSPQLTWLEPRAIAPEGADFAWFVPARLDGRPVALRGRTRWVAASNRRPTPAWVVPAGATVAGLLFAAALMGLTRGRAKRVP